MYHAGSVLPTETLVQQRRDQRDASEGANRSAHGVGLDAAGGKPAEAAGPGDGEGVEHQPGAGEADEVCCGARTDCVEHVGSPKVSSG